jgi:hypothetical protein
MPNNVVLVTPHVCMLKPSVINWLLAGPFICIAELGNPQAIAMEQNKQIVIPANAKPLTRQIASNIATNVIPISEIANHSIPLLVARFFIRQHVPMVVTAVVATSPMLVVLFAISVELLACQKPFPAQVKIQMPLDIIWWVEILFCVRLRDHVRDTWICTGTLLQIRFPEFHRFILSDQLLVAPMNLYRQ